MAQKNSPVVAKVEKDEAHWWLIIDTALIPKELLCGYRGGRYRAKFVYAHGYESTYVGEGFEFLADAIAFAKASVKGA